MRSASIRAPSGAYPRANSPCNVEALEYRILGPLEAAADGQLLELGGSRQRALLGLLLVHANEPLSGDRLIEELWGGEPRSGAAAALQNAVSRLRKRLPPGAIELRPAGYVLRVGETELDAGRFDALRAEARQAADGGDPARAAECLPRLRCGAASRWPTSRTSRSPRPRSAGSPSCGSSRSRSGSTPTSRSAHTRSSSPSSRR